MNNKICLPNQIVCNNWVDLEEKILNNDERNLDRNFVYFVQKNQNNFFACCYSWEHFVENMWKDPTKISVINEIDHYVVFTGPCASLVAVEQSRLQYFIEKYQQCVYYLEPCIDSKTFQPCVKRLGLYCSKYFEYMHWDCAVATIMYIQCTNYNYPTKYSIWLDKDIWATEFALNTLKNEICLGALSEEDIEEHGDYMVTHPAPLEDKIFLGSENLIALIKPIFSEDESMDRHMTVVELGLICSANYKIPHFYAMFMPHDLSMPSLENVSTRVECSQFVKIFWINHFRYLDILYLFSQWPTKMTREYQQQILTILWYPTFAHKKFWTNGFKEPYWEKRLLEIRKKYPQIEALVTGKYISNTPMFLANLFDRLKTHRLYNAERDASSLITKYKLPPECGVAFAAWNASQRMGLPRICTWYELAMLAWIWMYG